MPESKGQTPPDTWFSELLSDLVMEPLDSLQLGKGEPRLDKWLSDRPSEFASLLAARSALRLVPLLIESIRSDADSRRSTILLPSMRVLVSASLGAVPTDHADEVLSDASAVTRALIDEMKKTIYDVQMEIIEFKEIGEPEDFPKIHAQEEGKKGLEVVKDIMNAIQHAINTSVHDANYLSGLAGKDAPISAACATICACNFALFHLYDGHVAVEESDNKRTLSKKYTVPFNEFMVGLKQDIEVLTSLDTDAGGVADCLSTLSHKPLWFDNIPTWISEKWVELKGALPREEGWTVWIDWYESHLKGESRNETIESVFPTIPSEVWQDEVVQINSYLLEAVQTQWDPMAIALTDGLEGIDAVNDFPDLGQHRSRIMNALARDPSEAVGATKDFLEAVMKTILDRRGHEFQENIKFHELINSCWSELNLDSQDRPFGDAERLLRKISSQAKKMIEAANELRNIAGSGHGRPAGKEHHLTEEDARMIASIGFVLSGWLMHCEKRLNSLKE